MKSYFDSEIFSGHPDGLTIPIDSLSPSGIVSGLTHAVTGPHLPRSSIGERFSSPSASASDTPSVLTESSDGTERSPADGACPSFFASSISSAVNSGSPPFSSAEGSPSYSGIDSSSIAPELSMGSASEKTAERSAEAEEELLAPPSAPSPSNMLQPLIRNAKQVITVMMTAAVTIFFLIPEFLISFIPAGILPQSGPLLLTHFTPAAKAEIF